MSVINKVTMLSLATAIAVFSGYVAAATEAPTVFGNLNIGVTKVKDVTDIDGQAFEASLGVKGKFSQDDFTLIYKLEAEFTEAVNNDKGKSELEIKNAYALLPTSYGAFVVAPRIESGQQRDLYKPVDIFEVNEADSNGGLWGQPDEASAVFAYVSPKYNHTKMVLAVLTLKQSGTNSNNNDEDADVWVARVVHDNDGLYLGAGIVSVSAKQLPTDKRYDRYALTAGYAFDAVDLGITWESNNEHPAGNFDVTGVAANIKLSDKWSLGLGHTKKDADNNADDNSASMMIVRNQITENVYAYGEIADYDKMSGSNNDNYSLGVNIKF